MLRVDEDSHVSNRLRPVESIICKNCEKHFVYDTDLQRDYKLCPDCICKCPTCDGENAFNYKEAIICNDCGDVN